MAKKVGFDIKKVAAPPEGEPWIVHTRELITSPAWRARSIHCVRLLDFLEIEHMNHAGRENGYLFATYDQLQTFGIGRRFISPTITEAERLNLIEANRGVRKSVVESHLSAFRLTYLHSKVFDPNGTKYYAKATDEWKRITAERAIDIIHEIRILKRGKNNMRCYKGEL